MPADLGHTIAGVAAAPPPHRLAFVYEGVAYGGIEEYLLLLLQTLDRKRYTPSVVITGFNYKYCPPRFIESVEALGIPLLRTPDLIPSRVMSSLSDTLALRALLASQHFDVVHIHNSRPNGGRRATIAARLAGVPCVVRSEHLPPSANYAPSLHYTLPLQDWLTDYIIAGSDACLDEQFGLLHRNRAKTLRLYYGISLERFDPNHDTAAAKARIGLDPNRPVVGKIARLSPEKGYPYFLEAAAHTLHQRPEVQFLVVGNGPLEAQLRAQCESLGISDSVHFAGFQPNTVPYIAAMDVAVMASVNEGISLAMLEFMAMGKPIVATNEPSFAETVIDGRSGIITPLRDGKGLTQGIMQVLENPQLAQRLGEAAYRRVHEEFDIQANVARLMMLYDYHLMTPQQILAPVQ